MGVGRRRVEQREKGWTQSTRDLGRRKGTAQARGYLPAGGTCSSGSGLCLARGPGLCGDCAAGISMNLRENKEEWEQGRIGSKLEEEEYIGDRCKQLSGWTELRRGHGRPIACGEALAR
mmetsp:Transcript_29503/g.60495  ORF Transcript_29503/g.60495 Transcript_29503/m.60495 type:complete len:119 (-) Transcript_29503:141-497(-)